ncbi:MAG: hypothetical protein ACR2MN_14940 [Acidimicrobiales bacterium]
MSPAEVLAVLARLHVVVDEVDGRPIIDGVMTGDVVTAARSHRWLFTWGLEGARGFRDPTTGRRVTHAWHICDVCDSVQLLDPQRKQTRRCSLTVGCTGRMLPAAAPRFQPAVMARIVAS